MKRVLIVIVGLAGVGGLIALLMYHPTSPKVALSSGNEVPLQASTPTPTATSAASPTSAPSNASQLKDGTYTGETVNVSYGPVQVQAIIKNGKLTTVNVLQMPNDTDHAVQLANESKPILVQEAIQAQSPNVDVVSGATLDSQGFSQSLQSALSQAS